MCCRWRTADQPADRRLAIYNVWCAEREAVASSRSRSEEAENCVQLPTREVTERWQALSGRIMRVVKMQKQPNCLLMHLQRSDFTHLSVARVLMRTASGNQDVISRARQRFLRYEDGLPHQYNDQVQVYSYHPQEPVAFSIRMEHPITSRRRSGTGRLKCLPGRMEEDDCDEQFAR